MDKDRRDELLNPKRGVKALVLRNWDAKGKGEGNRGEG